MGSVYCWTVVVPHAWCIIFIYINIYLVMKGTTRPFVDIVIFVMNCISAISQLWMQIIVHILKFSFVIDSFSDDDSLIFFMQSTAVTLQGFVYKAPDRFANRNELCGWRNFWQERDVSWICDKFDIFTGSRSGYWPQTWINLDPSMDKYPHSLWHVGWNYLSIPKLQWFHHWSLGWISNFIPHITMDVTTYPCRD